MATYYLDYEGGSDAADGTSFANRWKTMTLGATAARIAPNDTIRIMGSPAPTSLGVNGTFTNKSATVTLASALNATVANCNATWTGSASVTTTADATVRRNGTNSSKNIVAIAFTTGKAAYFATGTLDLSAYQGITFWIRVSVVVAAASLSIKLCSDTVGATPVDTFVVPTASTSAVNGWYAVHVDKGSALGSSIQSVALYVDTDLGGADVTVYLDDISTVKAVGNDSLTLQSLIGTNAAGETWWAIRGIDGVTVTLDSSPSMTAANTHRGYYRPAGTQTVAAYKRETIKIATVSSENTVQDSGTAGNLITFSGGWNRTDMSTQTLETWWDGCTGVFNVINSVSKNYIKFTTVSCVRGFRGISNTTAGTNWEIPDGHFNNNGDAGVYLYMSDLAVFGTIFACSNVGAGMGESLSASAFIRGTMTELNVFSNASYGLVLQGYRGAYIATVNAHNNTSHGVVQSNNPPLNAYLRIDTANCDHNGVGSSAGFVCDGSGNAELDLRVVTCRSNAYGLYAGGAYGRCTVGLFTSSGNTIAGVLVDGISMQGGDIVLHRTAMTDGTKVSVIAGGSAQIGGVKFNTYLGTAGSHLSYLRAAAGTLTTELGAGRHTASGIAWTLTGTVNTYITSQSPLVLPLATLIVKAGLLVTAKAYFKRTNSAYIVAFTCRGRQIAGVDNEVTSLMTVGAGTWEQLTLTFTPSVDGVVELEMSAYSGAYAVTVDDMTISQG